MVQTLAKLLPIALVGLFLPTWTSHVLLLLGTDRPVSTSIGFILGNATYRFLLGIATLFVFSTAAVQAFVERLPKPGPFADAALALVLIFLGWVVGRAKPTHASDEPPRWLRTFEGLPPWLTFVWGFASCASPGIQYVYFFAGTAVIAASGLPDGEQILLLAVFVVMLQAMLVTPVIVYVVSRKHADEILARIKRWIATSGSKMFSWILIAVGVGLLAYGAYEWLKR